MRGAEAIAPETGAVRVRLRCRAIPPVARSVPVLNVRAIAAGDLEGEIERRLVHRLPELAVVRCRNQVDIGASHSPLIRFRAEIDPAPRGIEIIDRTLVLHLPNAAEGNRDPV